MNGVVALPLLGVLAIAFVARGRLARLHPATAARSLAVLLFAISVAAVPTLWLLGFGGLTRLGVDLHLIEWCGNLLPDQFAVGTAVGLTAFGAAVMGARRATRVLRVHRSMRCAGCGDESRIQMVDSSEVFAYTLPGPAGAIAISTGLRDALRDDEFDVVVAHESAHARLRHDRFLLIARLARAVFPPVAPLTRDLEYQIERWADEDAIDHLGADRTVAAHTIAKVGIAGTTPALALGITGTGTVDRARALLAPAAAPSTIAHVQVRAFVTIAVAAAALQVHQTIAVAVGLVA